MIYTIIENKNFIDTNKLKNISFNNIKNLNENISLKIRIDKRLRKYKQRYSDDKKIKFKKIDKEYEKWLDEIVFFLRNITDLNEENIFKLHKLFYPKGIWGQTLAKSGEIYYSHYKAGEYRKTKEFVANKNILFNYLEPENIESSIKNLIYWFNNDNETNLIIKIIIFYIYFLEIHPLSNGNGSIILFLLENILYKNNINFSITEFYNQMNIQEQIDFFKEGFKGNYNISFDILKKKLAIN